METKSESSVPERKPGTTIHNEDIFKDCVRFVWETPRDPRVDFPVPLANVATIQKKVEVSKDGPLSALGPKKDNPYTGLLSMFGPKKT